MTKRTKRTITLIALFLLAFPFLGKTQNKTPRLQVSPDKHYLQTDDSIPFFYLGDTGWMLPQKLDTLAVKQYLDNRQAKSFNVIQIMALHDVNDKDVYGNVALKNSIINEQNFPVVIINGHPERYKGYWYNLKWIINEAAKRKIYVGVVPIWGNVLKNAQPTATEIDNYTSFLCNLLGDCTNVFWILGGDIRGDQYSDTWKRMGSIIRDFKTRQLITFHPRGRSSSTEWFHNEKWLDFNMIQSGHKDYRQDSTSYGEDNWRYIRDGYSLTPTKPILDAEPPYEDIPHGLHDSIQPLWTANDVRRYAYWSVLSGACGFTYGNNSIMQFYKGNGDKDRNFFVQKTWQEALNAPGAMQMIYLKNLVTALPYYKCHPDTTLVTNQGSKYDRVITCLSDSFLIAYTYTGRNFTLRFPMSSCNSIQTYWYNPRNGEKIPILLDDADQPTFDPPGEKKDGNDWILVVDWRDPMPTKEDYKKKEKQTPQGSNKTSNNAF